MSTYSAFMSTVVNAFPESAPDPFYSRWINTFNNQTQYNVKLKKVLNFELDTAGTKTITPTSLALADWAFIVLKVIGSATLDTTGKDTDGTTTIQGHTPAHGTSIFPGYVYLSSYNLSALSVIATADDTTVEVFIATCEEDDVTVALTEQVISDSRLRSNNTSLTTGTTKNITVNNKITLTAGTWTLRGVVAFKPAATTTVTGYQLAISKTSATLPAADTLGVPSANGEVWMQFAYSNNTSVPFDETELTTPSYSVTVTANTDFYLVAQAVFGTSTLTAWGWIEASRVIQS